LTVVSREGDGHDIIGVTNKATGGFARVQIPQTKSLIPRSGQSKLTIRGNGNFLDKVVVTSKGTTSNTIVLVFASQLPDKKSLVAGSGQQKIGGFRGGGNGGYPSAMTYEPLKSNYR
jgi:hypothetical protein